MSTSTSLAPRYQGNGRPLSVSSRFRPVSSSVLELKRRYPCRTKRSPVQRRGPFVRDVHSQDGRLRLISRNSTWKRRATHRTSGRRQRKLFWRESVFGQALLSELEECEWHPDTAEWERRFTMLVDALLDEKVYPDVIFEHRRVMRQSCDMYEFRCQWKSLLAADMLEGWISEEVLAEKCPERLALYLTRLPIANKSAEYEVVKSTAGSVQFLLSGMTSMIFRATAGALRSSTEVLIEDKSFMCYLCLPVKV